MRHLFDAPIDPKKRRLPGNWEKNTNAQQKRLVRAYDRWGLEARREINAAIKRGATQAQLNQIVSANMAALETKLIEIANAGTKGAAILSAGKRAGLPAISKRIEKALVQNRALIGESLIPALQTRIAGKLAEGLAGGLNRQAVKLAFDELRGLPANYAGGYWTMIFEVQSDLGLMREAERKAEGLPPEPMRWVLDPRAAHCKTGERHGCPDLAGEYASWEDLPTVPAGDVSCLLNCRCHLEIKVEGKWRRGVYAD